MQVADDRGDPRSAAAWPSPDTITVTTWGSSSCPTRPVGIERVTAHEVRVRARRTERENACTADLGATTSDVRLPRGVARDAPLRVTLDDGAPEPPTVRLQPPREG